MKNILFIFKDEPWYLHHILEKFKLGYNVQKYIVNENLKYTSKEITKNINKIIQNNNIKIVVFDFDYTSIIDKYFVSEIVSEKKVLLSFDAEENIKKILSSYKVFSHYLIIEPTIVKKIDSLGRMALLMPLETNEKLFCKKEIKKTIDVLFFCELKSDRKNYLDQLKKTNINLVSYENMRDKLSDQQVVDLINKSKIILNFSKGVNKYYKNQVYYQFKGRILMAGLCKTFCLSEYSEGQSIHFKKKFPTFKNQNEMIELVNYLLRNESYLNELNNQFYEECFKFADINYFQKIKNYLEQIGDVIENVKLVDMSIIRNRIKIYGKKSNKSSLLRETISLFKYLLSSKKVFNLFSTIYLLLNFLLYFCLYYKKK